MVSGRTRRRSLIQLAGLTGLATLARLLPERDAEAVPLPPDDLARLTAGELIRVPLDVDLPQGGYFGGIAYVLIHAPLAAVTAVLNDPSTYRSILPMTLESRVLWRGDRDMQIYFRQGGRAGSAAYVILARRESAGLIRFWLDPSQPHEIADLWGYFRAQPWGKDGTVLTYAALIRLDFGMVKLLFTEAIRKAALGTPALVRAFVEGRQR
jgi:hypothetical protein